MRLGYETPVKEETTKENIMDEKQRNAVKNMTIENDKCVTDTAERETTALGVQVGGNHYKEMEIQPVEFCHKNGIGFIEGCVIKRMCRYKTKDPAKKIEDLRKAKHEIDLLIGFLLAE
jgi:hypothetical protein